ncbi:MAG: hypothetical protein ABIW57_11275 [Polyangia bacterium]
MGGANPPGSSSGDSYRDAAVTTVMLSVGGVVGRLELGVAPGPFLEQLRERYHPYTVPASEWVSSEFVLRVTFTAAAPVVDGHTRAGEVAAHPLRVEESDDQIRIGRWDFRALLSPMPNTTTTTTTMERGPPPSSRPQARWVGDVWCQMNPFAFDSLLRVVWAVFLPRSGGALFHACALRLGEAGVIFPGQSGAGKSTLARKVEEQERILTDELVAVSRGAMGQWRISGTPFWGEFQRGGGSIRSWPLNNIAFLEQAETLAVGSVSAAEATLRLLGCFLCFQTDADTAARNLAIAVDLCTEVNAVALRTRRDTPIADVEMTLAPYLPDRSRRDHPPTPREMISEFRWMLMQSKQYAYKPQGSSMRPWLRAGDALFIQTVGEAELATGDILLYWTPGPTADEDRLTCHRLVARLGAGAASAGEQKFKFFMKGDALSSIEAFENGRQSEILGRVSAVSRNGKAVPMPGRLGNLARLVGSLVATPLLKMAGR